MYDFVAGLELQRFVIDLECLIDDMLEVFRRDVRKYNWWARHGELRTAIANFLGSRGCLLDTHPYPKATLTATFTPKYRGLEFLVIGCQVSWKPPHITFLELRPCVNEGQHYYLLPRFNSQLLDQRYQMYTLSCHHSVSSNEMDLVWDDNESGFFGIAPSVSDMQTLSAKVMDHRNCLKCWFDIQSVVMQHYPDGVVLERTLRARVSLTVLRPELPSNFHGNLINSIAQSNAIISSRQIYSSPQKVRSPHTPKSMPTLRTRMPGVGPQLTPLTMRTRPRKACLQGQISDADIGGSVGWDCLKENSRHGDSRNFGEKDPASCISKSHLYDSGNLRREDSANSTRSRSHTIDIAGGRMSRRKFGEVVELISQSRQKLYTKNLPAWRLMSGFKGDQIDQWISNSGRETSKTSEKPTSLGSEATRTSHEVDLGTPSKAMSSEDDGSSQSKITLPSPLDEIGLGKRFPPLNELLKGEDSSLSVLDREYTVKRFPNPYAQICSSKDNSETTPDSNSLSLYGRHASEIGSQQRGGSQSPGKRIETDDCPNEATDDSPLKPHKRSRLRFSSTDESSGTTFSSIPCSNSHPKYTTPAGSEYSELSNPISYKHRMLPGCKLIKLPELQNSLPSSTSRSASNSPTRTTPVENQRLLSSKSFDTNDETAFSVAPLCKEQEVCGGTIASQKGHVRIDTPTKDRGNMMAIAVSSKAGEELYGPPLSEALWAKVLSHAHQDDHGMDNNVDSMHSEFSMPLLGSWDTVGSPCCAASPHGSQGRNDPKEWDSNSCSEYQAEHLSRIIAAHRKGNTGSRSGSTKQDQSVHKPHATTLTTVDEMQEEIQQYYKAQLVEKCSGKLQLDRKLSLQAYEASFWDIDDTDDSFGCGSDGKPEL